MMELHRHIYSRYLIAPDAMLDHHQQSSYDHTYMGKGHHRSAPDDIYDALYLIS